MYSVFGIFGRERFPHPVLGVRDGGHSEWWARAGQRVVELSQLTDDPAGSLAADFNIDVSRTPWARVVDDVRETVANDVAFSPLAWPTTDWARVGEFVGDSEFVGEYATETFGTPPGDSFFSEFSGGDDGIGVLALGPGRPLGAMSPSHEGFVAYIPPETDAVDVFYSPQRPGERERCSMR